MNRLKKYIFLMGMRAESGVRNPFVPKSEQDILDDLALARKHAEEGKCRDMTEALDEIGARYGFL